MEINCHLFQNLRTFTRIPEGTQPDRTFDKFRALENTSIKVSKVHKPRGATNLKALKL